MLEILVAWFYSVVIYVVLRALILKTVFFTQGSDWWW